jgi:hypothetical protein
MQNHQGVKHTQFAKIIRNLTVRQMMTRKKPGEKPGNCLQKQTDAPKMKIHLIMDRISIEMRLTISAILMAQHRHGQMMTNDN